MADITVIVPVYKVEAYLRRCVSSILAQTYGDFRLVLVDDGSPDNCGAMCDVFAAEDSRIHVIHQKNGGLSAARNAGIDWCLQNGEGQWLAFIDSDDWVDRTYLEQLHRAAAESGCLISACGFYKTVGESREPTEERTWTVMDPESFYCSKDPAWGVPTVAVCKLYHRSLLETIRYPAGKLHEDEFTTYRLVYAAGDVAVVPGALYAYFQNDAGIMRSRWSPRRMHALEAVEQQIAFAKRENHPGFLRKAAKQYIYAVHDQLGQADREYLGLLRKKLRWGLKQGRDCGVFPLCWDTLWAYEEAWPMKIMWWLVNQIGRVVRKEANQ